MKATREVPKGLQNLKTRSKPLKINYRNSEKEEQTVRQRLGNFDKKT